MCDMRYPSEQKRHTSAKILRAAGRLFRKQGYAATGVDAVMASVDLTAGGFYAHFHSKEDLLAATLDNVFHEGTKDRPKRLSKLRGHSWLRAFAGYYLSKQHRDSPDHGCPMPALATEVARIGGKPRVVFEQHLERVIGSVAEQFDAGSPDRKSAITMLAQCLGGVMLARAVGEGRLSDEILEACRASAMKEIEDY